MKILVLGGGISEEREVSLRSASGVQRALTNLGHKADFLDPRIGLGAVEKAAGAYDLVMPILHGPGDEDGVQEALDRSGTPYLGAGAVAAKLCMDKARCKVIFRANGIPTAESEVVTIKTFADSPLTKKPFVLKPVDDGSSVGLLIARRLPYDKNHADALLNKFGRMLLEEFVAGTEITVAMLGGEALPIVEIVPPEGQDFDFENKYNGASTELCPAEHISENVQIKAASLAQKVYRLVKVRHLARVDMIVRPDGSLVVLEINTLPGMTPESLFPLAAAAAGLSFDQMVGRLVAQALGSS